MVAGVAGSAGGVDSLHPAVVIDDRLFLAVHL